MFHSLTPLFTLILYISQTFFVQKICDSCCRFSFMPTWPMVDQFSDFAFDDVSQPKEWDLVILIWKEDESIRRSTGSNEGFIQFTKMSTTGHQSTSGHITMDILRCIEENELNQMIEDAGNTLAELNEGNVKYDVLQNAYNDAAKNLAKSLWSSIELAFINFAKDKCDGLIVPKERVVEFRRLAFPWNEYQGINLMLTRLEQFYLHESHQSPNEFDHYFDLTRQFIRNIKSMPQPDHEVLEQLNNRFRNSNTEN